MVDEAVVLLLKMRSKSHRSGLDMVPVVSQALHSFDWQSKLTNTENYLAKLAGDQNDDIGSGDMLGGALTGAANITGGADEAVQCAPATQIDQPRVDFHERAQLQGTLAVSAAFDISGGAHRTESLMAGPVVDVYAKRQDRRTQNSVDQLAEVRNPEDNVAGIAPAETVGASSAQIDTLAGTDEFLILVFKGSTDIMRNTLLASPALETDCRAMKDAGLELQPLWAGGAVVLLQPCEVEGAKASIMSQQPAPAHRRNQVITNRQKEKRIKDTLLSLPCRKRVKCSEIRSFRPQTLPAPNPPRMLELLDCIIIKNTFVHDWDNGSEKSVKTKSTGDRLPGHLNPRLGRI